MKIYVYSWSKIFALIAILLGCTIFLGNRSGRWRPLPPLNSYTDQLHNVPSAFGDWASIDLPLEDSDSLQRVGIEGFIHRQYRNRSQGGIVTVLLVCGRPGPICVHTPDVCYQSSGYRPKGEPVRYQVRRSEKPAIWTWNLRLLPPSVRGNSRELEIRWAWIASNGFNAAISPRAEYANEPAIYKIYIITERFVAEERNPSRTINVDQFVDEFVAELESKNILG